MPKGWSHGAEINKDSKGHYLKDKKFWKKAVVKEDKKEGTITVNGKRYWNGE